MSEFSQPKNNNWQLANNKIEKTEFLHHDFLVNGTNIKVTGLKGVIELENFANYFPGIPNPGCASTLQIGIYNTRLDQSNPDRVYIQLTPYYSAGFDDFFVPYLVPSGALPLGSAITIYNVSNEPAGANQGQGKFYINYEIYSF